MEQLLNQIYEGIYDLVNAIVTISGFISSLFNAVTTSFRFMLQSANFVANLQYFVPTVVSISCTIVIMISIVKGIFGR